MSPDLNPNRHTSNSLETWIWGRVNTPANVRELFQALKQEWVAIPAQVIHNLIQSMTKRRWAVTDSWGRPSPPQLPPTDVRVTQSQNTKWLNFFLDEKSV